MKKTPSTVFLIEIKHNKQVTQDLNYLGENQILPHNEFEQTKI
jgi:hypothetical protein